MSRSSIAPGTFLGSRRIAIGTGTHISYGCTFDSLDWIKLGRNCDIATNVTFITSTHRLGDSTHRAGGSAHAPIVVGDGCWIGSGVIVLPGVQIGHGVVIAAGSVVISDCDPDSLYAGVPAVRKKSLP